MTKMMCNEKHRDLSHEYWKLEKQIVELAHSHSELHDERMSVGEKKKEWRWQLSFHPKSVPMHLKSIPGWLKTFENHDESMSFIEAAAPYIKELESEIMKKQDRLKEILNLLFSHDIAPLLNNEESENSK